MKEINAYQCSDGIVFTDEARAKAHEDDLLGQELDGLLRLFELDITRNQEYKALLCAMKKRDALKTALSALIEILEFNED